MGQYYLAVNVDKKEYLSPHDYDNGLKIMEHSYLRNEFMGTVTNLLKKEWKGDRVIWLGDYFEVDENPNLPIDREVMDKEKYQRIQPTRKAFKGFLNNIDKEISIDLSKVKAYEAEVDTGWELHPLSLLTACGNGRGGGDFNKKDHYLNEFIGTWAGDQLSFTTKAEFKTSRFFNNDTNSIKFIVEDD